MQLFADECQNASHSFRPLFGDGQMHQALHEASLRLVREQGIACEKLTEFQMAEVIKQAVLCGDIVKNVRVGYPDMQSVVYMPYAESERLRSEIQRLKVFIKERGLEEEFNSANEDDS